MSGSPQLPRGKERRHKETKRKERRGRVRGSGIEEGNVCLEFTQRVHCVFRSVTVSFSELSGVYSDLEKGRALLCRQEMQVFHFI